MKESRFCHQSVLMVSRQLICWEDDVGEVHIIPQEEGVEQGHS